MSATPLIQSIRPFGGTFYAFSSAARDRTRTQANSNLIMEFSKFVALRIPRFSSLDFNTFSNYENYVQLSTIDGTIVNSGITGDINVDLSQSLQNYALNLESLMLSDDDFDPNEKRSIAERIFFKWLKEIGAIRFQDATDTEKSSSVVGDRFVEEYEKLTGTERYYKVVQYVGDLDVQNSVEKAGEAYTELYIRIPTQVGNTPLVLFESVSDSNYKSNLIVTGSDEYLYGRDSSTVHPDGLSIDAFYDYDTSISYTDPNANWHNESSTGGNVNSYFTELTTLDDSSNTDIRKYWADYGIGTLGGIAYRRSKLDGICIDFEPSDYYDIANDSTISTIQQYNSADKSKNFEFNAVLVYYDLYDTNNINDRATNLYGILFVDNVIPTADGGYIPTYRKYKPNRVTKLNGNSYGLSINLKTEVSITNGGIDTIVNEYSNFSMGLFSDATAKLQEAAKIMQDNQTEMNEIKERIDTLENMTYAIDDITTLTAKVDSLETSLINAQLSFSDSNVILDLIGSLSDRLQSLVNGNMPLSIAYNLDALQGGRGILFDKTVPNRIIINNKVQEYSIVDLYDKNDKAVTYGTGNELDLNTSDIRAYFILKEFTNMCRVYTKNTALNKLKIYIDDTVLRFENGQTIRFVFPNVLLMSGYSIEIYTDKPNRFGNGQYGMLVSTIYESDLLSSKPVFELVCVDKNSYTFVLDQTR